MCGNTHELFPARDTLVLGFILYWGLVTQTWLAAYMDKLNLQSFVGRADKAWPKALWITLLVGLKSPIQITLL